ncbi:glycosyltransferase family 2 protein [Paraglaciecola arctica]|uniref:Glycosyl transferase, group 2 family protein n=1 Tax=Paraglaciecola arctica BSs20135 TaxID=493475 RepID=K6ZBP4_9ALTE|nr:glycosyltransferase family 2 protein [Paraglaciecola arctica]GAC20825.1 glycosyl transferase, group 2 family protein [Paraglaciecola arctica BSs20135]|tara:strand:+ start:5025 stop:5888 length:864 start_codon:yes stop_codon:yes gene_type:complete
MKNKLEKNYKLCVGVPLYNEAAYIEKTLMSLKIQECSSDVLFIVSDNASTDDSWDICRRVIEDDPRFLLLKQNENVGAFINLKSLFDISQSEYFMWLGGHDCISDGYLNKAIDILDSKPEVAMACGIPCNFKGDEEPSISHSAIYNFSPKKLGRYIQSVRQLSDCTIIQSVFRRQHLDGFTFKGTKSCDHVIISRLLWFGSLKLMQDQSYFRRFFEDRDPSYNAYTKRISGTDEYLSNYDFINYYLDDFALLYDGDERMQRYVEHEIIDILQRRFGVLSLIPNDGVI